jgi:choline-sulfatase
VGVPLIATGADVPRGHVCETNATLLDIFPTMLDALGVTRDDEDAELPGVSLLALAAEPARPRIVFSEYHANYSAAAMYMLRAKRYKYVYYVDEPPQLFDMDADPDELNDLAEQVPYSDVLTECDRELRRIVDPDEVDARAKADQRRRIDILGGVDAVLALGQFGYTRAPDEFQ